MDSMKQYQRQINLNFTTQTNKQKIREFNKEDRTKIADDMQSRSRGRSLLSRRTTT